MEVVRDKRSGCREKDIRGEVDFGGMAARGLPRGLRGCYPLPGLRTRRLPDKTGSLSKKKMRT